MKLTEKEIKTYVLIVIVAGAIPYVIDLLKFISIFNLQVECLLDRSSRDVVQMLSSAHMLSTIVISLSTALYINISEKRLGNNSNILWQILGLIFGIFGFIIYAAWGIWNKSEMLYSDNQTPKA